jgi:cytoskeletal protein CcmA (bactofilin family)
MTWWTRKKTPPIRSLVGEGMLVHGDLRFSEGLRIDGEVQGHVSAEAGSPSLVVVSENARVHGSVTAAHVIINGEVLGPVISTELLELQPKARVVGDVRYEVLEMHQGAQVEGELRSLKTADAPALKLASLKQA